MRQPIHLPITKNQYFVGHHSQLSSECLIAPSSTGRVLQLCMEVCVCVFLLMQVCIKVLCYQCRHLCVHTCVFACPWIIELHKIFSFHPFSIWLELYEPKRLHWKFICTSLIISTLANSPTSGSQASFNCIMFHLNSLFQLLIIKDMDSFAYKSI